MSIFVKAEYGKAGLKPVKILTDPWLFMAFGFGSGLFRFMPGTFGTLAAIPLYYVLALSGVWVYAAVTIICTVAGVKICSYAAQQLNEHDFGGIVWDEVCGLLITMWFVPPGSQNLLYGFVLFRVLDMVKPWPICWLDKRVKGGVGIMLDDVVAGTCAGLILAVLIR